MSEQSKGQKARQKVRGKRSPGQLERAKGRHPSSKAKAAKPKPKTESE